MSIAKRLTFCRLLFSLSLLCLMCETTLVRRVIRDVLQTEIRKLRRKRAAAGWEVWNKMAHFRENPSERSARGPWNRTKFSVRFKAGRFEAAHVALGVWHAGRRINFSSLCLFYSYVIIFEIVELYSVDFVFSSMFSSSELQAITKLSISPSYGAVRKSEKIVFCS